jgi:Mrp family chromosome partitioning ATPase
MSGMNKDCAMSNQQDQHDKQDAEIKKTLQHIRNKILVMSGKGGVGKSSIAAFLAVALSRKDYRVGLMDVDLHGPSIPRLLGLNGNIRPAHQAGKVLPVNLTSHLSVISIETLMGEDRDQATIWRGPLKIGVIRQFISDLEWGDLDYLVIDSPPGTGDEPLTIAQTMKDAKSLIITTPQEISLADVRKSINFCRKLNMEILGLVENMGGFLCPHCGQLIDLFRSQGGERLAKKEGIPLLATLPLEPDMVSLADQGKLTELYERKLPFSEAFIEMVNKIAS